MNPARIIPPLASTAIRYFNSTFDSTYDYLVTIPSGGTGQGRVDALLQTYMPQCDLSILLVNDNTDGGSDGFYRTAIVSKGGVAYEASSGQPGILSHEVGHVLANLGDEYDLPYPGFPDTEEPNTTQQTNRALIKWNAWISPSTPVPTPPSAGDGVVGLFEGAHYHSTGWYRPQLNCAMRANGRALLPGLRGSPRPGGLRKGAADRQLLTREHESLHPNGPAPCIQPWRSSAANPQPVRSMVHQQRRAARRHEHQSDSLALGARQRQPRH